MYNFSLIIRAGGLHSLKSLTLLVIIHVLEGSYNININYMMWLSIYMVH